MKKNPIALMTILLVGMAGIAAEASDLQKIQQLVSHSDTICGNFSQQKRLTGVSKTINSSGRFCVDQRKGILWRNIKPFASTMRLTRNEIIQYRNGAVSNRISASREPMVKVINGLMFSLVAGDFSQLQQYFNVGTHIADNRWNATLHSKNASVGKIIKRISLSGDQYIRHVTLQEQSGDITSISFSGMKTGRSAVRPEEAHIF